jgi:type IV fimbrial biogenesis protein FimT
MALPRLGITMNQDFHPAPSLVCRAGCFGSRVGGLSLLELLVALAIAAILLSTGVPRWGAWFAEQELGDRADALLHALDLARSEAVKRGGRVDVCPGPAGCPSPAMPWEGGWTVLPHASAASPPPAIAAERAAPAGITIRGNRPVADYVSFTGLGLARRLDGALQMGTFTICRPGHRARKVVLANGGRARLERTAEPCP